MKRWFILFPLTLLGRLLVRAWSTPNTVTAHVSSISAADHNTYIRDNLLALKNPPSAHYEGNEGSDYTTASASFVDVDATNLALTISTAGGDVFVGFHGSVEHSAGNFITFDVLIDGTAYVGGDDGIQRVRGADVADTVSVSFVRLVPALAAGSHTFKLQWKTGAATATLLAGAGTANKDVHPQFWVRELS